MNLQYKRFLWLCSLVLSTITLIAQPKDNSPYSRLGLGNFNDQNFSSIGMAGLSAAYQDPLNINLRNPASYSNLMATSFEIGFNAENSRIEDVNGNSNQLWNGNLSYIVLGFPLKNTLNELLDRKETTTNWGMTLGLVPYTNVGYDISGTTITPEQDTATTAFQGSGGTYRLFWGNSYRVKNFSVGVNLYYLFGNLSFDRNVQFTNLGSSTFANDFQDALSVRGFGWDAGIQYRLSFKKPGEEPGEMVKTGKSLVFGLYGNTKSSVSTSYNRLYSIVQQRSGLAETRDTLLNSNTEDGSGTLPSEFTFGMMYEHVNKLRAGFEVSRGNWSQYEMEGKEEDLLDTWSVAAGLEWIPNASAYEGFLKRIRYRAGFYYRQDPRSSTEQLTDIGISLGAGLPIILPRQKTTFVNLALELGQFGTQTDLLENYARISVGFTLNDNTWFLKRKFD